MWYDMYYACVYMYVNLYVIVIAWEGVLYAEYSTRGGVERIIQDEAKPSAVLSLKTLS